MTPKYYKSERKRYFPIVSLVVFILAITLTKKVFSAEKMIPIIVNGDKVEFFAEGKKVIAEGNVLIEYQDAKLTCDKVTVFNETKQAIAEGDVILRYPKVNEEGEEVITVIRGKRATYNFQTKQGSLIEATIESTPFYGISTQVDKVSDDELKAKKAYITTCNLDKPHYRLRAKQILIYPGDKIVAKNVVFMSGECPVFYIPKYVQRIDDKRPRVTVVPGHDKDWGTYLLTAWRYYFIEDQQGRLHLDYREKKDFAWGVTHKYKISDLGEGLLKTYYMHERSIQSKHLWDEDRRTKEKERFKIQWYHKKEIDDQTTALLEYHKFKDDTFMKDYFFREYEKDEEPETYFLLTHNIPIGTFSFQTEKRVNRFYSASIERLPELALDTTEQEVFNTPLYFSNETSFSNLRKRYPNSSNHEDANRLDAYNKLSLPKKIAFINIDPFVGVRQTYFSEDALHNSDIVRGIFYTGIDLSTKFFRIFDVKGDFLGIEINKLRHVITPTIEYSYIHDPSIPPSNLLSFDEIDSIDRENKVTLSLENKLQTKRKDVSRDLVRFILSTDYLFKKDPEGSRFVSITSDLEITPAAWLRIESDTTFDTRLKRFTTVNADFSIRSEDDKWSFGFGERYERKLNRQLEMQLGYRINPKWKFSIYERFYPTFSQLKEQEYVITRDLHCWVFTISYNVTRGTGEEIWFALRLKAFPEMGFEFNKSYHSPKPRSQSEGGY